MQSVPHPVIGVRHFYAHESVKPKHGLIPWRKKCRTPYQCNVKILCAKFLKFSENKGKRSGNKVRSRQSQRPGCRLRTARGECYNRLRFASAGRKGQPLREPKLIVPAYFFAGARFGIDVGFFSLVGGVEEGDNPFYIAVGIVNHQPDDIPGRTEV